MMILAQLMPILRSVWNKHANSNIQNELSRYEEKDKKWRAKALVGNWIVDPDLPPRRVWDLYSNRVVPSWITDGLSMAQPISHAWVDEKDHVDVWTSITGRSGQCQSQRVPVLNSSGLRC